MDEASKHSYGGGQQRNQHPRPFFYVQPPSQPYYMYQQWHLNNPYSQYGLQGGFNYGRPCMHPYQYMQYPGFIFPHAPLYPMDYRRMFEPRFHTPAWSDTPRQQHQHQHQHQPPRRETACSEVQTDPSDVITKLMENLEPPGAERELDSGVASHSSGMFSPVEEKKSEEQSGAQLLPAPPDDSRLLSPAMAFSDSTTAVYDADSSRRSLEALSPQASWPGEMEEELPLDSSSVHEECADSEHHEPEEQLLPGENMEVTGIHSDTSVTEQNVPPLDDEEFRKQTDSATPSLTSSFASCQPVSKEAKRGGNVFHAEGQTTSLADDPSYQILKLPLESVLTSGAARAGRLSSPAAPYYYNYLSMQTTHERMSVLSPSLDELSSRDEMFSTDLEDMELFPKRVCAGRRLAGVVSGQAGGKDELEEAWLPGSTRFLCACCGNNLAKGGGRSKAHSSKAYRDDGGDSEESRYRRGCEQPVVRKISAPRKSHSVPARHGVKPWLKRGQYKEASDTVESEKGHDLCKQDSADGEDGAVAAGELQCRTCRDRLCRGGRDGDRDAIPRRRQATHLHRQEMSAPRKVMYHRPRDDDDDDDEDDDDKDDDEPPPSHWERGSTLRESRC